MSKSINTRTRYKIVGSDYSAQEPRLTTYLSGEEKMYDAYNNGKDLYAIIAQSAFHNEYEDNLEFYPEGTKLIIDGKEVIAGHKTHLNPEGKKRRSTGKVLNLATSYGMGGKTAGIKLGYTGKEATEKGQELLDKFFEGFPKVRDAIEGSKEFLKKTGYVEDFVGRRRRLPDIAMEPYEARLKVKPDEEVNFNPFFGCENRQAAEDPEKIWTVILLAEAVLANARSLAHDDGKPEHAYKAEYAMSNQAFNKLKKIADNPEYYLDNISYYSEDLTERADNFRKLSCRKKLLADMEAVKEVINNRTYHDKPLKENAEFDAIVNRFAATWGNQIPTHIPNDKMVLYAWSGRIAQAGRQCFNARVQGCLDGKSIIFTENGPQPIEKLVNKTVKLWDGDTWTQAIILASGKKQKCILTTALGDKIICSPEHKFLTINTAGNETFKKLCELKKQDRLIMEANYPQIHVNVPSLRENLSKSNQGKNIAKNRTDYSFDDIADSFIRGQVLGRIASDGSYVFRTEGSGIVYIIVAEHEKELLNYFETNLPFKYTLQTTQKKNQKVYSFCIYSTALAEECRMLNIKHKISEYFYADTNLLRGFISGFFDGDGTTCNNQIHLDFGTQADFDDICNDFKHALNYLGIKNTWSKLKNRYRVSIRRGASELFAERVGFLTGSKQKSALEKRTVLDNHTFNNKQVVCIKNIEVTDEYIDMFDACNTERGYFVVDGYVTHNSAASLTKIAMVDIFRDTELNDCQAKLIIPVHDELLVECPEYYSGRVEKRLPEVMVAAAAKVGDDVPQACDAVAEYRWYSTEYAAAILEEYQKLVAKGVVRDEAMQTVFKNHAEIPEDAIKPVLTGELDELIF